MTAHQFAPWTMLLAMLISGCDRTDAQTLGISNKGEVIPMVESHLSPVTAALATEGDFRPRNVAAFHRGDATCSFVSLHLEPIPNEGIIRFCMSILASHVELEGSAVGTVSKTVSGMCSSISRPASWSTAPSNCNATPSPSGSVVGPGRSHEPSA